MGKFKELRQHFNEVSQNLARLEKCIDYFKSSLNKDFVLSACENYLIVTASYPSIQIPSKQIAAIIEFGNVKGVHKSGICWIVHAELFGFQVSCALDEDEYKEFIKACKNAN